MKVNPINRNVRSVYKTHIYVVHFRKTDSSRLQDSDDKREFEPQRVPAIGCRLLLHQSMKMRTSRRDFYFSCLVVIGRT